MWNSLNLHIALIWFCFHWIKFELFYFNSSKKILQKKTLHSVLRYQIHEIDKWRSVYVKHKCRWYRISSFFRVSQILRKKLVHFLFCGSYFLRLKTMYRDLLWHTITNIIFMCFIFGELKIVAKNAKIRLPRKKTGYTVMKKSKDNIADSVQSTPRH
jgi:hypothetical protein